MFLEISHTELCKPEAFNQIKQEQDSSHFCCFDEREAPTVEVTQQKAC